MSRPGIALVEQLIATQFPHWAHLPVTGVELNGWDNTTFRLGEDMAVRLPSADPYTAQVDKERQWLPVLAPQLPLPIPVPLARGEPSELFLRPWSVNRWIRGATATADRIDDLTEFAGELAGFLNALYACEPAGPAAGPHSFGRGGPVSQWHDQTQALIADLDGTIDADAARGVWEAALAATTDGAQAPIWVHGDITGSNLVVRDGRLAGVIDFGCSAVGDPACDLTIAWTFFHGTSRTRFRSNLDVEPSAWSRARGWALWKACLHLGRGDARADTRVGWRIAAKDIVSELIDDLRRCPP